MITGFHGYRARRIFRARTHKITLKMSPNFPAISQVFAALVGNFPLIAAETLQTLNAELNRFDAEYRREVLKVAASSLKKPTVKQLWEAIYSKANLSGRAALSAFFLEDLLVPIDRHPAMDGVLLVPVDDPNCGIIRLVVDKIIGQRQDRKPCRRIVPLDSPVARQTSRHSLDWVMADLH